MLILPLNRSRSSQAHNLYKHCNTWVINASCQVSLKSVHWFSAEKIFEGVLPYLGNAAILVM